MLTPARGPRPWRAPRTGAERLQLAAWVQFALAGLYTAGSASSAIFLAHLPGICMDPGDPGCRTTEAPGVALVR